MSLEWNGRPAGGPLDLVRRLDLRVVVPALLLVAIGLWSIGAARPALVVPQTGLPQLFVQLVIRISPQ